MSAFDPKQTSVWVRDEASNSALNNLAGIDFLRAGCGRTREATRFHARPASVSTQSRVGLGSLGGRAQISFDWMRCTELAG